MAVVRVRDLRVYLGGALASGPSTLEAGQGEIVMIVGPNGAGKSTLLRAIAGIIPPDSYEGSLSVEGRPAYVPQNDMLLPWKTIRENIELGAGNGGVGLEDLYDVLGLWEHLDKYPRHVSGGTRRKAAIARGLATGANLLLLDEPFTGVDAASLEAIIKILEDLKSRGITIVIVTHQVFLVSRIASRALLLEPPPRGTSRTWLLEGLSKMERYRVAEEIVAELSRASRSRAALGR